MITAAQMRAARALLGIDQQKLADLAGVSLPTIQRMEASTGNVRGVVDTLMKVVDAFELAGIELIGENLISQGQGRGVRFKAATSVAGEVAGKATGKTKAAPKSKASAKAKPSTKAKPKNQVRRRKT